jgi:hypothetical protein
VLAGNQYGAALGGDGEVEFTFQRCEVSSNSIAGLYVGFATVRVSFSTITRNTVGLNNAGGGGATVESFNNNVIRGNATNTLGTITGVLLQ